MPKDKEKKEIGRDDEPTVVDEFSIGKYIKGLSLFISECKTPMTIAVQGGWGTGKTSLMKMVIGELDKEKVKIVEFNAWQFSQFASEDTLAKSLITTIIDKIGATESESGKELNNGLNKVGLGFLLRGAANFAGDRILGSTNVLELKEGISSFSASMKTIATLKEKFEKTVTEALSGKKDDENKTGGKKANDKKAERLLIFIDDLDRLQPVRAVELLEVLKIFLDCKNCVFVLAIDDSVVASGVKGKYGEDLTANKGRSFFDKIIQVPFKMPVPQYNIKDFVKEKFEKITRLKCAEGDEDNYEQLISCSVGRNPRSIKRLFNSYLLLLCIVGEEIFENSEDGKKSLFAILCMQQKFENLYNFIVLNSDKPEIINSSFFNSLADEDLCFDTLKKYDLIEFNEEDESDEVIRINKFIQSFNKTLTGFRIVSDDEEIVKKLRPFLKESTVTSSSSNANTKAKFYFNGILYELGAIGNNLGRLALDLIKDYSRENANMSAEELRKLVNEEIEIPDYYKSDIKKAGLGQVNYLTDVNEKNVLNDHFAAFPIEVGDDVLLVAKAWGKHQVIKLISLLQYKNRIKSNMW
jgi:hypothetical protein